MPGGELHPSREVTAVRLHEDRADVTVFGGRSPTLVELIEHSSILGVGLFRAVESDHPDVFIDRVVHMLHALALTPPLRRLFVWTRD